MPIVSLLLRRVALAAACLQYLVHFIKPMSQHGILRCNALYLVHLLVGDVNAGKHGCVYAHAPA